MPFNDPLPNDYFYATLSGGTQPPLLRVYYNPIDPATKSNSLAAHLSPGNTLATATSMAFFDRPADPCLTDAGGGINSSASANALCGGAGAAKRAPAGQTINFTTRLVGLQGRFPGAAVVDTGIGFTWTTTYNGTSGGLAILRNDTNRTDDPGGTGGVTITGYTPTTTYNGVNVSALNGSTTVGGPTNLLAAVLPASRSAVVNGTATAFATIINSGAATAPGCSIALATGQPVTFHYQTTDPKTNAVTGKIDTPVDIPAGAAQSFVIALTPTAAIAPTDVPFTFTCANTAPAPVNVGLNTLLFSASATQPPDVVALAATVTNDGVLHIPGNNGTGAFSVATVNVGVAATITASANTGSAKLPVALTICQTNPSQRAMSGAAGGDGDGVDRGQRDANVQHFRDGEQRDRVRSGEQPHLRELCRRQRHGARRDQRGGDHPVTAAHAIIRSVLVQEGRRTVRLPFARFDGTDAAMAGSGNRAERRRQAAKTAELTAALEHHRAGRLDRAEALYRKFLEKSPGHPDGLHLLGIITLARGDPGPGRSA